MKHIFFNGWQPLLHLFIVGIFSYAALILMLRIAGKRTLSRMNAYDMVITMALGSILAKVLLTPNQSLSESLAAMALLIALQYCVSVAMCRCPRLRQFVSSQPTVLFHEGQYVDHAMKKERIDKDEVQAAIHEKGISDIAVVEAVILGANGDLSVLLKPEHMSAATKAVAASKHAGEL